MKRIYIVIGLVVVLGIGAIGLNVNAEKAP